MKNAIIQMVGQLVVGLSVMFMDTLGILGFLIFWSVGFGIYRLGL